MATHSSLLAWRILWTEEPGGLQSMESQRVRQDLEAEHICVHPPHTHAEKIMVYLIESSTEGIVCL